MVVFYIGPVILGINRCLALVVNEIVCVFLWGFGPAFLWIVSINSPYFMGQHNSAGLLSNSV